jgi:aryl-alcohol dehydrogenase-like predicted oxidoreductase
MPKVMTRTLGRSGIEVSAMGLGCWAIGGPYTNDQGNPCGWSKVDDEESIRAIRRGLELGINLLDTAACYGCGHSEEVVGRAVKGQRDQVVIATKFWHQFDPQSRQTRGTYASVDDMPQACEDSLRRLQTDYIDLYQFHQGNYPPEQADEVREMCERLVQQGKIRWYGWSTDDPERAAVFARGEHCTAIQQRMNLFEGNVDTLRLCERENLASLIRSPFYKGLATGKFTPQSTFPADDVRAPHWDLKAGREADFLEKLGRVKAVLTRDGRTPAQAALGWLWARSDKTIPIPGFKTVAQVEENAGAMAHGPLTDEQMREVSKLLQEGE